MVSTWDPNLYLRFTGQRLRPALDPMAHVPLENARTVYELGCGAGNVTQLLHERWPRARMIGVDASREMLENAKTISGGTMAVVEQPGVDRVREGGSRG
jgi:trans-aconitate 2-methyltransferase